MTEKYVNPSIEEIVGNTWYRKVLSVTDDVLCSAEEYLRQQGLVRTTCPVSTNSISSPMAPGSDSIPLEVTIAGRNVYLADSMQFFLEVATRLHKKGVYYTMTSFRGEQADSRHLNEFTHLEAEINLERLELMQLIEGMLTAIFQRVMKSNILDSDELERAEKTLTCLQNGIPRVTHDDAVEFLSEHAKLESKVRLGKEITACEELLLLSEFGPVMWLERFPEELVPFYQTTNGGYAECADLLGGVGEFLGMGQRCFDEAEVLDRMQTSGVDHKPYRDYLMLKRLSPMTTSGFGLGVERLVAMILGQTDIRTCSILPRDYSQTMRL